MSDDGWRWSAALCSVRRAIGRRVPKPVASLIAIAAFALAIVPGLAGPRPMFRAPAPAWRPMPPPMPMYVPRQAPMQRPPAIPNRVGRSNHGSGAMSKGSPGTHPDHGAGAHAGQHGAGQHGAGQHGAGQHGDESQAHREHNHPWGEFRHLDKATWEHEHRFLARRAFRHAVHWRHHGWALLVAGNMPAVVIDVPSGDTITIRNAFGLPQRFRLFGTAAPQSPQTFASVSQQNLSSLVLNRVVNLQTLGSDIETADPVAKVSCDGVYVNYSQIAEGMAWNYVGHGLDLELAAAESEAMAAGKGIWSEEYPEVPWASDR